MSTHTKSIEEELKNLYCYLEIDGDTKLTVFTKTDDGDDKSVMMCTCDGCNVFTYTLSDGNITDLVADGGFSDRNSLLDHIRSCFQSNTVKATIFDEYVITRFEKDSLSLTLKCHSTTAVERKTILQYSYLKMADELEKYKARVKELEESNNKRSFAEPSTSVITPSIFEPDVKRPKVTKPKVNKNSSIVNPGVRKKKAARGVVFDD
ncbi:protein PAXX-like [Clytia hemisphaerica]|uniref:Uncharacterized protein n=1 Tax=Clytia hemisphaerica TaxID=252671 RepID=A0A7M5V992_9CNID|eukprot:TCONS_00000583-protein